jgi:predicted HAD superfamily Cof-like phosphohydrolase
MKKLLNDVAAFQYAYDAPCHPSRESSRTSGELTSERVKLRLRLIFEEAVVELLQGHGVNTTALEVAFEVALRDANNGEGPYVKDPEEIADALGDSIYVEVGMALEYGIPLDHVWDAIQESNMKKFPGGKVIRRESDGKVMKPEGWEPPDIKAAISRVTDAEWARPKVPAPTTRPLRDLVEQRASVQWSQMKDAGIASGNIPASEYAILRLDALLDILSERGH